MPDKKPESVYQVKITLQYSQPPIWRRLLIDPEVTLYGLHVIIQVAFGWEDDHLHEFTVKAGKKMTRKQIEERRRQDPDWHPTLDWAEAMGLRSFGLPDRGMEGVEDESEVSLGGVLTRASAKMLYRYDFGDDWKHEIQFEKRVPRDPGATYPVCVAGERMGPWEDCGGLYGWEQLIQARTDPDHPYREYFEGFEDPESAFDPEHFDMQKVNKELQKIFRRKRE